ncbi:serine/threonine protein kinase [Paenibacillus sp. TRM 82003]|nr:serine/threonine protein kinase [Paenibacillus sp. TRM 82003]
MRLLPGDAIQAKWSGHVITVERWLGEGANGSVYLARFPGTPSHCALKIGCDAFGLQSEINVLREIGSHAPKLLLSDDGQARGNTFPFYLMSFVPGSSLSAIIDKAASSKRSLPIASYGERLLVQLSALHAGGWSFGDLKPDNVMVSGDGDVRLIDYGGATRFGRSAKQFTELYDRGFWKAGSRKADAGYDLFAFAVLMLEAAGERRSLRMAANAPERRRLSTLLGFIDGCRKLTPVAGALKRMLRGDYADANAALRDWRRPAPVRAPAPRERARWPAAWLAGAAVSFAAVWWWVHAL